MLMLLECKGTWLRFLNKDDCEIERCERVHDSSGVGPAEICESCNEISGLWEIGYWQVGTVVVDVISEVPGKWEKTHWGVINLLFLMLSDWFDELGTILSG